MSAKHATHGENARMQAAIAELKAMIRTRYPSTTFTLSAGEDDPDAVHLIATVDIDDPDEVVDLVIGRMLELQIDEALPIFVIPVRTPERVAAMLVTHPERGLRDTGSSTFPYRAPASGG